MKVKSLSHVQLLATPWFAAYQAPPSMGFSRQDTVRDYNTELYATKTDVKETDKILRKDYLSKFNHVEIENINRPVLVQDGGVEGHTLINSCESKKIAINFGTTIDGRILEPTKKGYTPCPKTKWKL